MIVAAILLMMGIILIYFFDEQKDYTVVVGLGLIALFIISILIGNEAPKSSKKKITPKIKVECENNKCDTTYIYE